MIQSFGLTKELVSIKIKIPVVILLASAQLASARDHVRIIEFYGYKGIDVEAVRKALPLQEGDAYSRETDQQVRKVVKRIVGREATYVGALCCDDQGDSVLFIGLPGESSTNFVYNPEPKGTMQQLSKKITALDNQLSEAVAAAVHKGGDAAQEDDSNGYALLKDPTAHALQLAVREYALQHKDELLRVLKSSSDSEERAMAADALGYGDQSQEQISALVWASRDPEETVRNNATRALAVLASSKPEAASQIPPEPFVAMLRSGIWTDRNKASMMLSVLTRSRDRKLLAQIRAQALDALVEMAQWRDLGHAFFAKIILARLAGIPEERMPEVAPGPVQVILDALKH